MIYCTMCIGPKWVNVFKDSINRFAKSNELYVLTDIPEEFIKDVSIDEKEEQIRRANKQRTRRSSERRSMREKSIIDQFKAGFDGAVSEGREVHREAFQEARQRRGQDIEAPRISQTFGTNPTFTRTRDFLKSVGLPGGSNTDDYRARIDKGLGLQSTTASRIGQMLGTGASDIVQDRTRSLWWLLNAPQAVTSVTQEGMLSHFAPSLYKADHVLIGTGAPQDRQEGGYKLSASNEDEILRGGYGSLSADGQIRYKKGYRDRPDAKGNKFVVKQRYRPGSVDSLLIPSGIAINAGIGLLNPVGGNQGYEAVFADKDDPTKTNNVIGEIAAKYILGRTGNLLNWDEFKEQRPDVSKGEYNAYKAFKWDKNADWNPFDDGKFTVPTGVLKGTTEGIHGPEIQFLGRSLPLATTIMPTLATIAGTVAGAGWEPEDLRKLQYETDDVRDLETGDLKPRELRKGKKRVWGYGDKVGMMNTEQKSRYRKINRVRNGLVSGMGSLLGSSVIGNMIEGERRRRNAVENELKGGNAEQYLGN